MNTETLNELLQELRKPFHPSHVTWKPGILNEDRTRALALAYADLRAYQNRLDEVCGLDWSVTYTPWGDRVICHLTIRGITRSSTGEPDSQSERSEIAGTAAEAQAFKRACAMFGLGRYLYNLPSMWVDYDNKGRSFTDRAKSRLELLVHQHYQRWMAEHGAQEQAEEAPMALHEEQPALEPVEALPQPQNGTNGSNGHTNGHANGHTNGHSKGRKAQTNGRSKDQTSEQAPAPEQPVNEELVALHEQFEQLGRELYTDQWEHVSRHNVERITGGQTSDSSQLSVEQMTKLINGLKSLQRKRSRQSAELEPVAAAA
jgi:hypothetical protein